MSEDLIDALPLCLPRVSRPKAGVTSRRAMPFGSKEVEGNGMTCHGRLLTPPNILIRRTCRLLKHLQPIQIGLTVSSNFITHSARSIS